MTKKNQPGQETFIEYFILIRYNIWNILAVTTCVLFFWYVTGEEKNNTSRLPKLYKVKQYNPSLFSIVAIEMQISYLKLVSNINFHKIST